MTPRTSQLSRRARRLHGAVIAMLALQLLLGPIGQPLGWGCGLLTLMAALKLRESQRPQDLQRAGLAELMALGVLAVISPDLGSTLLQLSTALLVVAAVLCQEGGNGTSLRQALKRSLQLGIAALPLLVLLFILMPRIGPLWSVSNRNTGTTGLSDQLEAGTITQLVQDPAPALKISYLEGEPPPPEQRYWRVLVLDRFDGRRWSATAIPERKPQRRLPGSGLPPAEIWVAEPSQVSALPWAGHGTPTDPALTVNADGVLVDGNGGWGRRRYGFRPSSEPSPWQQQRPREVDLAFNPGANPQLEARAMEWAQTLSPPERAQAARRFLDGQGLRYTLSPTQLPDRAPLDALLFQTRNGFCEHFASAFTALMRAAGVPARVVIGYQGGTWIPADRWGAGFLDVRQRDAHAWSEIWLEPQGWVRMDPTAWLAPQRITEGEPQEARRRPWLQGLELGWTRLDLAWSRWVLGFDADGQARLLGRWLPWQGILLIANLAVLLAAALWWLQRQTPADSNDRQRQELERTLRRLTPFGLQPQPGEDLLQFCERAASAQPAIAMQLRAFARCYTALRFAPRGGRQHTLIRWRQAHRALDAQLRRLRPRALERVESNR